MGLTNKSTSISDSSDSHVHKHALADDATARQPCGALGGLRPSSVRHICMPLAGAFRRNLVLAIVSFRQNIFFSVPFFILDTVRKLLLTLFLEANRAVVIRSVLAVVSRCACGWGEGPRMVYECRRVCRTRLAAPYKGAPEERDRTDSRLGNGPKTSTSINGRGVAG